MQVAVVVEREGGGVVPHPALQAQRADAGVDQQRRAGVPQCVKTRPTGRPRAQQRGLITR